MLLVSVIIPSYKDPYLWSTIQSLLDGASGDLEIIPVLDGYWPEKVYPDPRVKYLHLGANRGMRRAINAGISLAKGQYLMRSDEHCAYAKGWDAAMIEACAENAIVTPRRYFIDPTTWTVMDLPPWDYERLEIRDGVKFEGRHWRQRERERGHLEVDETMSMQGSCWMMRKAWWEKVIGELDHEHYGPLIQDSHEMVFKTWKAGGKLLVTKKTWFAHKHVSFSRTHNQGTVENPARCDEGYAYALKTWKSYYEEVIRPRWFGLA
jgi:glycosyltransferase involved in cell wall biosynthesis